MELQTDSCLVLEKGFSDACGDDFILQEARQIVHILWMITMSS